MSRVDTVRYQTDPFNQLRDRAVAFSADHVAQGEKRIFAESYCHYILQVIWEKTVKPLQPSWELSGYPLQAPVLDTTLEELAWNTATHLLLLDPPLADYRLGTLYSALLPSEIRSELGVFYTPPPLVRRLIATASRQIQSWKTVTVLDPACGGAAFLAPIAVHMARHLCREEGCVPRQILEHVSRKLQGIEIDPFAAWMSQVLTELRLFPFICGGGERLPNIVRVSDALAVSPTPDRCFDLVIGNPPYGKIRLEDGVRKRYSRSLYGHANLYGLFTDLALRLATREGTIAFVTPTSFLAGQYFKALRRVLVEEALPVSVDFVVQRDGVFTDVLQETALVVFKKGKKSEGRTDIHTIDTDRRLGSIRVSRVTRYATDKLEEGPWLLPRSRLQSRLLDHITGMKNRLSDFGFSVSTGPLVWNRHKAQLREEPGQHTVPLIWSDAIFADGTFHPGSDRSNHKPFFEIRADQYYLLTSTPCILVQRTTAKEQPRRLIATLLPGSYLSEHPGGVVIENHLNLIRNMNGSGVSLSAICQLLNSKAVDQVFRCISGSVAVSAYELNAIPLPQAKEISQLDQMLQENRSAAEVEAFISGLYGMNE